MEELKPKYIVGWTDKNDTFEGYLKRNFEIDFTYNDIKYGLDPEIDGIEFNDYTNDKLIEKFSSVEELMKSELLGMSIEEFINKVTFTHIH